MLHNYDVVLSMPSIPRPRQPVKGRAGWGQGRVTVVPELDDRAAEDGWEIVEIPINELDLETFSFRERIPAPRVKLYADLDGYLPLVKVAVVDGQQCVVGGRIRVEAAVYNKRTTIRAKRKPMDYRSALLEAVRDNRHGLELTRREKQKAVRRLLMAFPDLSDRAIAAEASVDHKTVARIRRELNASGEIPQVAKRRGRDGKVRESASARRSPSAAEAVDAVPMASVPEEPKEAGQVVTGTDLHKGSAACHSAPLADDSGTAMLTTFGGGPSEALAVQAFDKEPVETAVTPELPQVAPLTAREVANLLKASGERLMEFAGRVARLETVLAPSALVEAYLRLVAVLETMGEVLDAMEPLPQVLSRGEGARPSSDAVPEDPEPPSRRMASPPSAGDGACGASATLPEAFGEAYAEGQTARAAALRVGERKAGGPVEAADLPFVDVTAAGAVIPDATPQASTTEAPSSGGDGLVVSGEDEFDEPGGAVIGQQAEVDGAECGSEDGSGQAWAGPSGAEDGGNPIQPSHPDGPSSEPSPSGPVSERTSEHPADRAASTPGESPDTDPDPSSIASVVSDSVSSAPSSGDADAADLEHDDGYLSRMSDTEFLELVRSRGVRLWVTSEGRLGILHGLNLTPALEAELDRRLDAIIRLLRRSSPIR